MENDYELMYVLAPDLKADQLDTLKGQILNEITGLGATIENQEDWGKRDLAFEVKDYRQGFYHLIQFKAPAGMPTKLRNLLRVNERIIRYLLTKREIITKPAKEPTPDESTGEPGGVKEESAPEAKAE